MKNGELSVILKSVTVNDTGIYECSAAYNQQEPQLLNSINLTVAPPEVKVTQGEDATLECYGPSDATNVLLRWTKPDLQIEGYVIYLKDGHFQGHLQNPSFKGRVKLKDSKWMKNGNFSVILQNVTMNDSGTYKCEAGYNNQPAHLLNSTSLTVVLPDQSGGQSGGKEDEGEKSGSVGLIVGLSVLAVLVIVGVGAVFIYRTYRRRQNPDYRPPVDQGL